jgi:hypothetical protein
MNHINITPPNQPAMKTILTTIQTLLICPLSPSLNLNKSETFML